MAKAPALNTLVIAHQDGPLKFKLERGGYFIKDGLITISIRTEAMENNEDRAPEVAYFCLQDAPIKRPLRVADKFRAKSGLLEGAEEREPKASAYFSFHAEEVDLTFTVEKVSKASTTFSLKATHDDVDYYDKRAKITPTKGLFELKEAKPADMWIPV